MLGWMYTYTFKVAPKKPTLDLAGIHIRPSVYQLSGNSGATNIEGKPIDEIELQRHCLECQHNCRANYCVKVTLLDENNEKCYHFDCFLRIMNRYQTLLLVMNRLGVSMNSDVKLLLLKSCLK